MKKRVIGLSVLLLILPIILCGCKERISDAERARRSEEFKSQIAMENFDDSAAEEYFAGEDQPFFDDEG